jgi:hypothetical protein
MAAIGIAPREVRIVILTVGLLAASLLGGGAGLPPLSIALGLITILAIATTIQRIVHVIRQASSKEHQ